MRMFVLAIVPLITALLVNCEDPIHKKTLTVIPEYSDEWKLVEVRPPESDEIWMFRKNLGVSEIKGLKTLPTLVYFTVQFAPKDSSGLPSKEDAKLLYDFEEEAIPEVEKDAECVLVASVVKGGVKDHLFYVSDPDRFMSSLSSYRDKLGNLRISLEKHEDPDWDIYADFPDGD